jgi:hypothetical protein
VFRFHRCLSFLIRFLQLAAQRIAAPAGGCFHLSLYSTEMAERSSGCDPDAHADTYAYCDAAASPNAVASAASPDSAAAALTLRAFFVLEHRLTRELNPV